MALTPPQAFEACSTLLAIAGTGPGGYLKHVGIVTHQSGQRLLNVTEMAEYLGVERTTVYRCGILDGLKPVRVAGRVLYDIVEVDTWIALQKDVPNPSPRRQSTRP